MRIVRRETPSRIPALLVLSVVLLGLAGQAAAQSGRLPRVALRIPEPTEEGYWDGTYWYVSRDWHVAMWIRTVEGRPEVQLRLVSAGADEDLTTDWNGEAAYETRKGRGTFALRLTERDANRMKGTWNWNLEVGAQVRKQRGEVTLFRAGFGREVVLLFDPYEFYIGPAGEEKWQPVKQSWTFRKASKRLVLWDELPF